MSEIILTKQSLFKLRQELDYLKNVKRKEIIKKIKEAKEFGDLSENAAYKEAREEESFNESKIKKLEHIIKNAKIVDTPTPQDGAQKISLGSVVTLEKDDGEVVEYMIVEPSQADFASKKISINSPLAKALIDKTINENVIIKTPQGQSTYKIIAIN